MHSASRSTASVLRMLFSKSLVIMTSSSDALSRQLPDEFEAHRPVSKALDAIGEISLVISRKPS